jgi:MFS family permease
LIGSALCLPVGRLIDRVGVRTALVAVAAGLGLAVVWMTQATGWLVLFLALVLVRGLGQGALSLVSMAMVGKWFTRRLGVAMGLFSVLLTVGFIVSFVAVGEGVKAAGWRGAWAGMGWAILLGLAPLGLLLARSTPESVGLAADPGNAESRRAVFDMPPAEALRTPAFWVFTAASAVFYLAWTAVTLDHEELLRTRGFDYDAYIVVGSVLTFVGLPTNLLGGWLAQRWHLGKLLAVGMAALAGALALFPFVADQGTLLLYAGLLGVAGGVVTVVFFAVYGTAYGRAGLGTIVSVAQVLAVVTSAFGPVLLTESRDVFGSYTPLFLATAGVSAALAVVGWRTRLPGMG